MATPKTLVLTGFGINCDHETQTAFERAGAIAERVHVNDIIDGLRNMDDYQILAFPGGFSYGDDIRSGKVMANKVRTNLADPLRKFIESEKLIIGICNGFQVMVNLGLISEKPAVNLEQRVTLTSNDSYRYEDRWVTLSGDSDKCVFTKGIERLYVPVAHGEGKFFAEESTLDEMEAHGQVAFRYSDEKGGRAKGSFPQNPNGALRDIAGACDPTGRVFGMMPHPERHLEFTNHPRWTAIKDELKRDGKPIPVEGEGMKIFHNAVEYFR